MKVFNDPVTKNGLIQDCEIMVFGEYGRITENEDLMYQFTNLLNDKYDLAISIITANDGRWQADDASYSSHMVYTTPIVSGQWRYSIDPAHTKIIRTRIKDLNGKWHKLNLTDIRNDNYPDFGDTLRTGLPMLLDKQGDQLLLDPIPNFGQAASLEVTTQRIPNYFVVGDTDKIAGIHYLYSRFLSLGACDEVSGLETHMSKSEISRQFGIITAEMTEYYSMRNKDEHPRLQVRVENTK